MKINKDDLVGYICKTHPFNVRKLPLLSNEEVIQLKAKMFEIWGRLHEDYFPEMSLEEFDEHYLFHESIFMKCLAWRFASCDIFNLLYKRILEVFDSDEKFKNEDFVLHPIFYARISKASSNLDINRKNAFLDSQPHFDRSFNAEAFSFWLALDDVDNNTGGLCFFSESSALSREFDIPWGEKNRYSTNTYYENYKLLDPLIKKSLISPNIRSGSAYMFDSFTLHAATKPISSTRVSFDFRLIEKKSIDKLDNESQLLIKHFIADTNFSNAMNLLYLGDHKGALYICPDIYSLADSTKVMLPLPVDIKTMPKLYAWRSEYQWIRDNKSLLI